MAHNDETTTDIPMGDPQRPLPGRPTGSASAGRPLPERPTGSATAGRPLPERPAPVAAASPDDPARSASPSPAASFPPSAALSSPARQAEPAARKPAARPDPRPMRFVYGAGSLVALSALTVGLIHPSDFASAGGATDADLATAIPTSADARRPGRPQVVHRLRYVKLKPGQTAPPGALVIRAPEAEPNVVARGKRTGAGNGARRAPANDRGSSGSGPSNGGGGPGAEPRPTPTPTPKPPRTKQSG